MDRRPPIVAITGAAGYVGTRLLQELEPDERLERVIAIDTRSLPVPFHNCATERHDVSQPMEDMFMGHGVNTVVHLAFVLRPGRSAKERDTIRQANLKGTRSVLSACRAAHVRNFIYLSSHTVYGAHRDNPLPITEEAPLRPSSGFQYSSDKALCEEVVEEYARANPGLGVTVLRSCVVMGAGADNYVTNALFKPVLMGVMGCDPPLQFVHEDDLAKLLHVLIREPCPGTYNVAGEGVIRYSRLARLYRRPLVFMPSAVAYPVTQMAWNLGIQKDAPAAGLDFVRYPVVVSTGKLKKDTGFRFFYTSEEALMSYLPGDSV